MPTRRSRAVPSAPRNSTPARQTILIGTPTLGQVRIEWHNAIMALIVPTNWQQSLTTPIGYLVADAQNIICREAFQSKFDWVLFLEDDTVPPPDLFQRLRPYVQSGDYPVVAGLYHLKSIPPEPMVYRGRGNGPYLGWKPGQVVRCDGVPTGCTLMATKLLRAVAAHRNDPYEVSTGRERVTVPRVFHTPREYWSDPATSSHKKLVGTSDLDFCDYVLEHGLLKKAGWPQLMKRRYPFVVDTRIHCGHIDRSTGQMY